MPTVVIVYTAPLPPKTILAVPTDILLTSVSEPKIVVVIDDDHAGLPVVPVQVMLLPSRGISAVTV